jgi:hypothetical protein
MDGMLQGGLIWQNHPSMPSVLDLSVKSPDGLDEVRLLPAKGYTWIDMLMLYFPFLEGSYYRGNQDTICNKNAFILQYLYILYVYDNIDG